MKTTVACVVGVIVIAMGACARTTDRAGPDPVARDAASLVAPSVAPTSSLEPLDLRKSHDSREWLPMTCADRAQKLARVRLAVDAGVDDMFGCTANDDCKMSCAWGAVSLRRGTSPPLFQANGDKSPSPAHARERGI